MFSGVAILALLFLQRGATYEMHQLYGSVSSFLYLVLLGCIVAIVVTSRKKPQV